MTKLFIGQIINTHGIKGEIRIKSDLTPIQKNEIFKIGTNLIIDNKKYLITGYRQHKSYDMVTFDGFNNINQVLFFKGKKVYKDRNEINLNSDNILDSELITYKVKTIDNLDGKILDIEKTGVNYKIIRLLINKKQVLVPYHKEFIKNINTKDKEVLIKLP